jgi:hypothetical protein
MGVLAEELDQDQREQRAAERQLLENERARSSALEAPLIEFDDLAELLVAATLAATGYHRHDRGEWRRRRG